MEETKNSRTLLLEAGVDEAGKGPLAGPVTAAAVILDPEVKIEGLRDSKKLSAKMRDSLAIEIKEKSICWNVVSVDHKTIDSINILQASLLAMKKAILGLETKPDVVLVDGENTPDVDIPSRGIIKGDQECESIMAASIIAKVTRDALMLELDKDYPDYGFKQHKGYGTKEHLLALKLYGPCEEHRETFRPVKQVIKNMHYKYSDEWKNRCLVRDRMRKMNDHEIGAWLTQLEKEKSAAFCNELRKLLREEWSFVRDASRLRNFSKF